MADHEDTSPDIYFEPIVQLKPVEVKSLEEDEEEIYKERAKLYRYAIEESPVEWKERGTGEIKLLKKRDSTDGKVRLLMRRDKTFKICANHYVSAQMILKPNCGSDKAFVWNTPADFADEEPKPETLAIRFKNPESAKMFKEKFEECQRLLEKEETDEKKDEEPENDAKAEEAEKSKEADEVAEKLGGMTVNDADKTKEESDKEPTKAEETQEETKEELKGESKAEMTKEDSQGSGDAKEES